MRMNNRHGSVVIDKCSLCLLALDTSAQGEMGSCVQPTTKTSLALWDVDLCVNRLIESGSTQ